MFSEFKLGNYISGKFSLPSSIEEEFVKHSPSDVEDKIFTVQTNKKDVDRAVEQAANAFFEWRALTTEQRISSVLKIQEEYKKHRDILAETIARETGKPLWESKTEVNAMIAKFDVTINHSLSLIAENKIENALKDVDGVIRYKPRGVMAVIGPFNFPGHLPNGHIVPALITGNTVVFKPSELTPATGQLMAQLIDQAGLPAGVFNMVQGGVEVGKRLVAHELVDGVLFTGSYDAGLKIKEKTLTHHWKLLALEMGGKNASVVWEDADMNKALFENLVGAFITSGQRCSCTSRILVHEKVYDQFVSRFYEQAKKIKIGHWRDDVFFGPLINEKSVEKYLRFQDIAFREKANQVMRGKVLEVPNKKGLYVTPSIYEVESYDKESIYQNHEIFGPNVVFYKVKSIDEVAHINNAPGFGLVASIFTANKELYLEFLSKAKVGLVNWNRTTNGASSRLPFGGSGRSGNDRPTAHFAVKYCTTPVASLEDHRVLTKEMTNMPGLNYRFDV